VDNFYVDGESDELDDLDFSGYMLSGVNNSALFDDAEEAIVDHDGCEVEEDAMNPENAMSLAIHINNADDTSSSHVLSSSPQKQEEGNTQNSTDTLALSATNMALLQRAYQAEQSRFIETLSCSESSADENEGSEDGKIDEVATGLQEYASEENAREENAMVEALKAFQEFSPRYRNIQTSELLNTINKGSSVSVDGDVNSGEVTRWYDDVEVFVED